MSIPIIDVFRDSSSYTSPLPLSLRGRCNLFTLDLEWCIRCIVKSLRILMSTFVISLSYQLIIIKIYVATGSAKELIASILLRAFNSLLRIDLTLRRHYLPIFFPHRVILYAIPFSYRQIFITFPGFKIFNDRCGI